MVVGHTVSIVPAPRGTRAAAVVVAVILVVSVAAAVALTVMDLPDRSSPVAVATQRVTVGVQHVSTSATMTVRYSTPAGVLAPPWHGIVRKVWARAGRQLSSGDKVAAVGATTVRALATAEPMYRTIRVGDSGSDVTELRSALAGTGISVNLDGAADPDLRSAFMAFSGIAEPMGVVARPEDVVWLPQQGLQVAGVMLAAGQDAPPGGSVIVQVAPVVTSATIPESPDAEHATVTADLASTVVPVVGGQLTLDSAARRAILGVITASGSQRSGESIDSSLGGQDQAIRLTVTVTTRWADGAALVPTAAILTDHAGGSCIVLDEDGNFSAAKVQPVGSAITTGTTVVLGLKNGQQIVLNAPAADVADACA